MLHYNPQHVSSSTFFIFRRTNCIITASGNVTLCKRPYSMPVESGLQSALNRHMYCYRINEVCIKLVTWKESKNTQGFESRCFRFEFRMPWHGCPGCRDWNILCISSVSPVFRLLPSPYTCTFCVSLFLIATRFFEPAAVCICILRINQKCL